MMDTIKDKLARVAELATSGHELEREVALELLREVYSEIKYGLAKEEALVSPQEGENCVTTEIALDEEPAPEEESAPEPEPEPEPEEEPEEEPQQPIIPRPVAPEVIRSLYGDEGPTLNTPSSAESNPPAPSPSTAHDEPAPRKTLGDAMSAGHRTLGESLHTASGTSVAANIAATEHAGLRRSIGLNDRFLMIRDMFAGDAGAFDRTIEQLDTFTDLDEAVLWIHDNFDWAPENRGATLLVGLLERKLGH
jgi:hypothetical protein